LKHIEEPIHSWNNRILLNKHEKFFNFLLRFALSPELGINRMKIAIITTAIPSFAVQFTIVLLIGIEKSLPLAD
jgi:hypothetical protein